MEVPSEKFPATRLGSQVKRLAAESLLVVVFELVKDSRH